VIVATNHKDEKLTGQYRAYQYPPIASIAAFSRGLQSKSELENSIVLTLLTSDVLRIEFSEAACAYLLTLGNDDDGGKGGGGGQRFTGGIVAAGASERTTPRVSDACIPPPLMPLPLPAGLWGWLGGGRGRRGDFCFSAGEISVSDSLGIVGEIGGWWDASSLPACFILSLGQWGRGVLIRTRGFRLFAALVGDASRSLDRSTV
jgi:hypothetical protein